MMRKEIKEAKTNLAEKRRIIDGLMAAYLNFYLGDAFGLRVPDFADTSDVFWKYRSLLPIPPRVDRAPGARATATDGANRNRMLQLRALQKHRSLRAQLRAQIGMIRSYRRRINSLSVEIQKKYSIPVACLVFVLIGAPLGVMARSGGLGVGGGISLGFFLLYWASLIGGEDLADRGIISPFVAMWLANILVGACGIYLVVSSVRETRFIRFDRIQQFLQENWTRLLLFGVLLKRRTGDDHDDS